MKTKSWITFIVAVAIIFPMFMSKAVANPYHIEFNDEGGLTIKVTATAATTGIRYRVVGWMITADRTCSSNNGSVSDCRPLEQANVTLINETAKAIDVKPNPPVPGQPVTHTWEFDKATVEDQLFTAFNDRNSSINYLYVSAVMESYNSSTGVRRAGPFYTLNGIKNAEGWAHAEDLNAYFDMGVPYVNHPVDVQRYIIDANGTKRLHDERRIDNDVHGTTVTHTFPETINLPGGRQAQINRSYIIEKQRPNVERFVQQIGDANLLNRNFNIAIGGNNVVAEYVLSDYPATARFIREDDGTPLRGDEELGQFAPFTNVKYDFKPNEFMTRLIGGFNQTFQLVRTYIIYGDEAPAHIQEENDAHLLQRSITMGERPSAFVGEYRMVRNPVIAIAQTEDGTILKRTSKGEFEVGEPVSHTFDQFLTSGGYQYEIIQSYMISNRLPNERRFIQNSGDPNLMNRNITTSEGGNQLVAVYRSPDSPPPPPPPPLSCAVIETPSRGASINGSVMDPGATGVLRADSRGAELFQVEQGIPTSEALYANVLANQYLFQHRFVNLMGEVTYTVPVTKTFLKTWTIPSEDPESEPQEQSAVEVVTEDVAVKRPYSYWVIDNLEAYRIQHASLSNYALGGQGGSVMLNPSGYTPPSLQSIHSDNPNDHVFPAECEPIDLGEEPLPGGDVEPIVPPQVFIFQAEAERLIGRNQVKNDRVVFNGATIMNDALAEEQTMTPTTIPSPPQITSNILYQQGLMISRSLPNRSNNPTTGQIQYTLLPGNIKGGSDQQFAIGSLNAVTVHTPTVMYPTISNDYPHNQKIHPAHNRAALILDRTFTVNVPTSGQHRGIQGYGNRDYAKYMTLKQVYFPFDVYDTDGTFYAKNQWISIPVTQQQKNFFLPVWVDEGFYDVSFRSFAENYPSSFTYENSANLNVANHVAVNTVPVDVIGRLYDFRITDIADFNWERVFRTAKGSATHTPNVYYVGQRGIDGALVGNRDMQGQPVAGGQALTLPIRPGSHPENPYRNWVIKSGYHFKFEVKTKGNMDGLYDAVRIIPSFSFVRKDGTGRIPVDLYYHDMTNRKYFVRVGSADDRVERQVVLADRLRNVPEAAMNDTARFMSQVHGVTNYLTQAKRPKTIGRLSWLLLPYEMRTLIGPQGASVPASVPPMRALGSVQSWHGEYSLPATLYAVATGTNIAEYGRTNGGIREDAPIFLKDGFIIVSFNIETIRNRNLETPYLRYYPLEGDSYPYNNQWVMEGFASSVTDKSGNTFQLRNGDVAFYHADHSSNDDFGSSVTH